jgi:transglutaminase-like putative cysteine protease
MEKAPARDADWLSAGLLFLLIQVAAARLVITNWAAYLYFAETLAALGTVLGLALGASRYGRRAVVWFVIDYTLALLPWQMTAAAKTDLSFSDRFLSIGGILLQALHQFLQRQPVKDPLFFVAAMCLAFWMIALAAGYWLARHHSVLAAIVPAGIAILTIQVYDDYEPRSSWWIAAYVLIALLLLGREYYLRSRKEWNKRRVSINEEAWSNIFGGLFATMVVAVWIAWLIPTSLASLQAATDTWSRLTKPIRERLSNAVSPLESPYGAGGSNFYGETLALGRNAALGDSPVLIVEVLNAPDFSTRYYWRGRAYDFYSSGQWTSTPASRLNFQPRNGDLKVPSAAGQTEALFEFTFRLPKQSLLYAPSQPVWVNHAASVQYTPIDAQIDDVIAWEATPAIQSGSRYRVRAEIADPNIQELRAAGTSYPEWVKDRYLEIPGNIRPEIQALAEKITGDQETPYDKAAAITDYLRANLQYATDLPAPPEGRDPLLWVLFTYKKGFCNYYASAEVLLLRSVGIPARLAVGFAQGEGQNDTYTVRQRDAHAWPEVYFPGVGWVEFEPTASQAALVRPQAAPQTEDSSPGPALPQRNPIRDDEAAAPPTPSALTNAAQPLAQTVPLRALVIGLSALGIVLLIFLLRRYRLPTKLPLYLSRALEGIDVPTPVWMENWSRWNQLSPVEQSFTSINLSLRWLGKPQPMDATPAERAATLKKLLPSASAHVEALRSELESALFTPRPANSSRARRASLLIVFHTFRALVLNFLGAIEGRDVY